MRYEARWLLASAVGVLVFAMSAAVPAADEPASEPVVMNAKSIRWAAAPPSLPKGARVAVLYGNPSASGRFVMRLWLPAKYHIPLHAQPAPQQVTVISGTLYVADDATYSKKYAHAVSAGGFVFLPANAHRFMFTKGATVVEIHGAGPFEVKYVDPNDDPQKWAEAHTYYFPKRFLVNEMNAPGPGEPIPTF
ncbi:MAG: cupin domain-containing protein [Proteobacteria bacterium]|nr:cupin domain-containing protein [Pseudomonadota bacterium]